MRCGAVHPKHPDWVCDVEHHTPTVTHMHHTGSKLRSWTTPVATRTVAITPERIAALDSALRTADVFEEIRRPLREMLAEARGEA